MVSRAKPLRRSAFKAWRVFVTRWNDNDAYGHVNNIVHYQWFDSMVNSWLIDAGLLDIEKGEVIGLVVSSSCSYFAPVSFPKPVELGMAVEHIGTSSVRYRLGVFGVGESGIAAQGEFTHVYVDRETRRPVALPKAWRARLESLAD